MEEDYYSFIQLEIESFSALLRVKTDQRATSPPPKPFFPKYIRYKFQESHFVKNASMIM